MERKRGRRRDPEKAGLILAMAQAKDDLGQARYTIEQIAETVGQHKSTVRNTINSVQPKEDRCP